MALETGIKIDLQTTGEESLKRAFSAVAKEIQGLSGMVGKLDKVLEQYEKKQSSVAKKEQEAVSQKEQGNKVLLRQKEILSGLSREFSRGESSVLAMAKASGASKTELKELERVLKTIRTVIGSDPFDNSIGGLRKLQNSIRLVKDEYKELRAGSGLTKKDLQELSRVKEQVAAQSQILGKQAGLTGKALKDSVKGAVDSASESFKKLSDDLKEAEKRNESYRQKVKTSAEALENRNKVLQEAARNEKILQEMQKRSFSKSDATRFVDLRDSGFSITEAKQILQSSQAISQYEQSLKDASKAAGQLKRQQELNAAAGDQMVAQFRANQQAMREQIERTIASSREQLRVNELAKRGFEGQSVSRNTAQGIVGLQGSGASSAQIAQFIELRKQIEALDPVAKKTAISMGSLSAVVRQIIPTIGAVGLGTILTQTAIQFIKTADAMSLLKNRMKLVLDETQNFNAVYSNLVNISVNNRASLQDTVTLFNRLTPALKANGIEAGLATTVVDSFQKTLLISGASVRETSSAILQLSQAFAAGRLNGDEFRSISEAAPEFLRTFSRATGIAAGALKELAADGKLTTEVLTAAMVKMNKELSKAAQGIDITFSQSVQILGTRLSVLVDSLNETTGLTKALAKGTFEVSEVVAGLSKDVVFLYESNRELFGAMGSGLSVLTDLVLLYGAYKAATFAVTAATNLYAASQVRLTAVKVGTSKATNALVLSYGLITSAGGAAAGATGLLTGAFTALTAAIRANPIGLLATALTAVAGYFIFASDSTDEYTKSLNQAADTTEGRMVQALVKEQQELQRLIDLQKEREEYLKGVNSKQDAGNTTYGGQKLKDVIEGQRKVVQQLDQDLKNYNSTLADSSDAQMWATKVLADFGAANKEVSPFLKKQLEATKSITEENKKLRDQIFAVGKSSLELAKAKATELQATALQIEADATLAAGKGDLDSVQRAEIEASLLRAEAIREQAKLVLELANAESKQRTADSGSKSIDKKAEALKKLKESLKSLEDKYIDYGGKLTDITKFEIELQEARAKGVVTGNAYAEMQERLNKARDKKIELEATEKEIKLLKERSEIAERFAQDTLKEATQSAQSAEERNRQLEDEIARLGLKSEAIAELEAKTLSLRATELRASAEKIGITDDSDVVQEMLREAEALEKQIGLIKEKAAKETSIKQADDLKKEFDKIQDDVAKSITDAIANGGKGGKEILKNLFKAQVFRIFIEPVVRNTVGSIAGALGVPGANSGGSASAGGGGLSGFGLQGFKATAGQQELLLKGVSDLSSFFGASATTAADLSNSLNSAFKSLGGFGGALNVATAAVSAYGKIEEGKYLEGLYGATGQIGGGILYGPIGAFFGEKIGTAVGRFWDKTFGFGKPSGRNAFGYYDNRGNSVFNSSDIGFGNEADYDSYVKTGAEFFTKQYEDITKSLGGQVKKLTQEVFIKTDVGGTSPNDVFFSTFLDGKKTGSFGGNFGSGNDFQLVQDKMNEFAMRNLIAVLKETNFQGNINSLFDSINQTTASIEQMKTALADAELLNTINNEFPKLGGALATLANQSIETIKAFVLLSGGIENLQSLQSSYIQAIYTDEEKLSLATSNLNKAFASLNIAVPSSISQFKDLVESQNLSTVQGQATYLALLQLSGAFAEVTRATEESTRAAEEQLKARQEEILQERLSLEKELYDLVTSSTQQLQDQRNALDASNRSLFDQIQSIKQTTALREELTEKIKNQESDIANIEDRILSLQSQATQNYLAAQQKVVAAQERVNQLTFETANNFLTLGKSLRDFVKEQRQGSSSGSFQSVLTKALQGDAEALAALPSIAGSSIAGLQDTSRSALEAEQRKAAILQSVSLAAAVAESLGAGALQEDPMVLAQRELTIAQNELANALAVANEMQAPLVENQQNLLLEYTRALQELSSANNNLNALLLNLNVLNSGGFVDTSTPPVMTAPVGSVTMPSVTGTSPAITAPVLEQKLQELSSKFEQLIVENRAGLQAIANNTGKSSKILERADDGDSINVRVLTS